MAEENNSIEAQENNVQPRRVILNFLDPKKPILPEVLGGAGNSVAAMDKGIPNTTIIYVDKKNHFDDKGRLKPLKDLPPEYKKLICAEKVDVIGHGSAGSGVISSDYWAYNFDITFLRWCPSPFPRFFGTGEIASILKNCKNAPEVELLVCEGAKDKKDYKGVTHKSLVTRLTEKLQDQDEGGTLPSKIRGYKETIAITSLGNKRCSVWIPITPVEKFSAILLVLFCIIPVLGPLVALIITGLLEMLERGFRSVFSVFGLCDSNDEIEKKRKQVTEESVVEVKPQASLNGSDKMLNQVLTPLDKPNLSVESEKLEIDNSEAASPTPTKGSTSPAGAPPTPTNESTSSGNSLRP